MVGRIFQILFFGLLVQSSCLFAGKGISMDYATAISVETGREADLLQCSAALEFLRDSVGNLKPEYVEAARTQIEAIERRFGRGGHRVSAGRAASPVAASTALVERAVRQEAPPVRTEPKVVEGPGDEFEPVRGLLELLIDQNEDERVLELLEDEGNDVLFAETILMATRKGMWRFIRALAQSDLAKNFDWGSDKAFEVIEALILVDSGRSIEFLMDGSDNLREALTGEQWVRLILLSAEAGYLDCFARIQYRLPGSLKTQELANQVIELFSRYRLDADAQARFDRMINPRFWQAPSAPSEVE